MPLRKSFSEQNHTTSVRKNRPQWTRNRSFPAPARRSEEVNPSAASKRTLVPVSSATRNKLSAFNFESKDAEQAEESMMAAINSALVPSDNKENMTDSEKNLAQPNPKVDLTSPGAKELKPAVPSTPAGRLALPDLIDMIDVQTVKTDITPDERILWDHGSMSTSTSSYPSRRGKKRARSSSPVSSPSHISSHFDHKPEPLDLRKLSQSLTTPKIHTTTDLWDRYAGDGIQTFGKSSLAHIMFTSSPQSTKQASNSASRRMRRSITCGNQWPRDERLKRRKMVGHEDSGAGAENVGPSKLALVSALLGKVNESNQASQARSTSHPRSSSPTAPKYRQADEPARSAEGSIACSVSVRASPKLASADIQRTPEIVEEDGEAARTDGSSDYGDFDEDGFDASMAEELLQENATKVLPEATPKPEAVLKSSVDNTTVMPKNDGMKDESHDSEEFDDLDDDVFDEIVAGYDESNCTIQENGIVESDGRQLPAKDPPEIAESDDEFGDGLDDVDFEAAELAATQSIQHLAVAKQPLAHKARKIQRYLVTTILESEYVNDRGRTCPEKLLLVNTDHKKSAVRQIVLRDGWYDTPVTLKAFVHVIGDFDNDRIVVDDAHNMLILHPDHLLSSTVVADSFTCTRRAVLQDRVKATSEASQPLVYGTILHEIFQAAMLANRWDTEWLSTTIEACAGRHVEDLYTIKLQLPQAVEYLKSKMNELQSWAEAFMSSEPKPAAVVKAGNSTAKATMCVSKLLDVEEHVWSPMYGLKGNIDATVQVTMLEDKVRRTLTVPFEVKTGKNANAAHRAQTALYNLLLSDRYDIDIAYGILYYMETSETIRIPAIRHEVRHMIMQRNELACFVRERHAQLPSMLKNQNVCKGCYAKPSCFIYHRLADDGTGETSGLKDKFDELVKHLTPQHKEFFLKWDDLLTKEEKESLKFRRELWTMLSTEREKLGRCFANVIIEPGSAYEEQNNPKINRYRYTMIKQAASPDFSFQESQITIGEPIVISDESGHFALANGYITHVKKHRITVAVDRRLHNARIRKSGFDAKDNQVFASIMEVAGEGESVEPASTRIVEAPTLYRLDKDEFSNGLATVRNNLIQIMAEGPFGSREIRNLVVDLKSPRFKPHSTSYILKDRASLNVDQRRAIEKVMSAQDYALVLGMPGTGKTTTIAHIIQALVSQGKSVLLTSYTHSAVDNILLKLKDDNPGILRLGAPAKVHPDVQQFATLAAQAKDSFEDIRSAWHDNPVVATTCLGINHPVFNERTFDYCIVDEASQITLPVCLGPIRLARTFILVGDHYQLPPLVQNEEARVGGLDISLFKHLSDEHPTSVVNLEHQYRMCEDVMALSNNLIYSGRLKCGTPAVAARSINIPRMAALDRHHFSPSTMSRSQNSICTGSRLGSCWVRDLMDPGAKCRFLNTDPLLPLSREESKGNRIVNHTEARIVTQLVESLLTVGVAAEEIGVMTHYRSQLSVLRESLRSHKDVEMHTADRFQGRDKEVVILSLVRSNEAKSIGELLKDWRRINVAFTRAKTKLLVVGSRETLKGTSSDEMVAKFVGLMEEKNWIYDLPKDALDMHLFEDEATQVTMSTTSKPSATQWKPVGGKTTTETEKPKRPAPKRVQIGGRALLAGKPILKDIINATAGCMTMRG